jgi:hypothetical protein
MKAIMAWTGGRAPPSQNKRLPCAGLVGLPKLAVLSFQRLRLHVGRNAGPLPAVDLGLLDPVMQRLRRAADLGRNGGYRRPARRVLAGVIQNHPYRSSPDLG